MKLVHLIELFSTWNLLRLSGFLAFFYMTVAVSFGMLFSLKSIKINKSLFLNIHFASGWIGFLASVFHGIILWWNNYLEYSLAEIVIPFISTYKPISSGLGTLSLLFFLVIWLSGDFWLKYLKGKVWRYIHLLVYPAWLLMFVHGIWIGTSTGTTWATVMYGGSFVLIFFLLGLKLNEQFGMKKVPLKTRSK